MEEEICPHCGEIITEEDREDYWMKQLKEVDKKLKSKPQASELPSDAEIKFWCSKCESFHGNINGCHRCDIAHI